MHKKNVAYFTPKSGKKIATFSKTHYERINGNVFLYHGTDIPPELANKNKFKTRFIIVIDILKRIFKLKSAFTIKEQLLIQSLKDNKVEVVYIDFGPMAVWVMNVCKALNLPVIVAFLGYDISVDEVVKKHAEQYKKLFSYAYKLLIVSKHMEKRLTDLGCPKNKIVWSPYPPEDFFIEAQPNFIKNNFFMMGGFVDKKAPYYSILAFKKVLEKHPDSLLNIAGKGPLFDACVNLVNYLNIKNSIKFVGNINQKEAFDYFESSLAFIQHSIRAKSGDMEGTPVAILEASLAGLPIISTMHAGIPDVIINNKTGILVNEHDVDAMANAMCFLIENKNFAKQYGDNGKKFIKENFHVYIHMKLVNGLLEKAEIN